MVKTTRLTVCALAVSGLLAAVPACKKAELKGAEAEVEETSVDIQLPPVPEFDLPEPNADGSHPVREMRLQGKSYVGSEVKVKGYVIWIYDCASDPDVRKEDMTDEEIAKHIEEHPEDCDRPNFYLGSKADAPADKGVWVVDVPRAPRPDELKTNAVPEEELERMITEYKELPPFEVGDEVEVTGTWDLKSPLGFRNSDGLLVFGSMKNLSQPEALATKQKELKGTLRKWRRWMR